MALTKHRPIQAFAYALAEVSYAQCYQEHKACILGSMSAIAVSCVA